MLTIANSLFFLPILRNSIVIENVKCNICCLLCFESFLLESDDRCKSAHVTLLFNLKQPVSIVAVKSDRTHHLHSALCDLRHCVLLQPN